MFSGPFLLSYLLHILPYNNLLIQVRIPMFLFISLFFVFNVHNNRLGVSGAGTGLANPSSSSPLPCWCLHGLLAYDAKACSTLNCLALDSLSLICTLSVQILDSCGLSLWLSASYTFILGLLILPAWGRGLCGRKCRFNSCNYTSDTLWSPSSIFKEYLILSDDLRHSFSSIDEANLHFKCK